MGKEKWREYQCQEISELMTYSFLFNLVGYLTRDICVGMAGLRMQDSGEGDIERISMYAVHFSNHAIVQYCGNARLVGMIRCMNYFADWLLFIR